MKQILGRRLIAEKTINAKNALELMTSKGIENIIQSSLELKKLGVGVIVLACTGMSTVRAASRIEKRVGIRVVDPVIAEGVIMWSLLKR